jgi:hypothetical protein
MQSHTDGARNEDAKKVLYTSGHFLGELTCTWRLMVVRNKKREKKEKKTGDTGTP